MQRILASWQFWALGSAGFAALTAIFAKVGVQAVNSDYALLPEGGLCSTVYFYKRVGG